MAATPRLSNGEVRPVAQGGGGVRFVDAPPGDVATVVRSEMAKADAEHRALLVYAGATWCEPCQRFHAAAGRGELDKELAGVTFLAFDVDQDRERLYEAGYRSKYIPLFVVPGKDGRSTGRQIEGSIKGEGAADEITPRLRELLGR